MLRVKMKFTLQQIGKLWSGGGKTAKRWGRKNPAILHAQRYPKDVKNILYLHVIARQASATPPLGPTLGQFGIPIIKFCDQFNLASYKFRRNTKLSVVLYQTYDNDFHFDITLPMTSILLKKVGKLYKGSGQAGQAYNRMYPVELMEKKALEDALRQEELLHPKLARDEKYAELDPRVKKQNKKKVTRKPAKRKSYLTKHQNVVGTTRFLGITPQMLYEVRAIKYIQYLNGGYFAFDLPEFDKRYVQDQLDSADETVHPEASNAPMHTKYRKILRTYEMSDAYYAPSKHVLRASTTVMRSLFRLCRGTMRSMGSYLVPDMHMCNNAVKEI